MCAKKINDDVPKNLYKRSDGRSQNWFIRLTAPSEIHHLLDSSEWQIRTSTGTSDTTKAKAVLARVEAKYRAEWEAIRATARQESSLSLTSIGLTDSLIAQICGARLTTWDETDDIDRMKLGIDSDELQYINEFCLLTDGAMRSVLSQMRESSHWNDVVGQILEWCEYLHYAVEPTDPLFPKLVRSFADVEKRANEVIYQRNVGNVVPFPQPEKSRPLLSVMELHYTENRKNKVGEKTFSTGLHIWQRFVKFCGDISIDDVTSHHVYTFLRDRMTAKIEPWSESYALVRAKGTLKRMFALARTLGLMTSKNPVLMMEINPEIDAERAESRNPRRPYSVDRLNALFASDWYNPDAEHWTGKMKHDLGARYWAPLICLYHGLRVREVAQLHSHDFDVKSNTLLMAIQVDLSETESKKRVKRSLKNSATKRVVPVHPQLMKFGLKQFVDAFKLAHPTGAPLFPSSIPDEESKKPMWGRSYEQAFLRHVRDRLDFGSGYGNHSFRHTTEDRIRSAQAKRPWPPGMSQYYTGRKLTRDADRGILLLQASEEDYGDGYQPLDLVKWIATIKFDDVTLPPPFAKWLGERSSVAPELIRLSSKSSFNKK